MVGCAKGAPLAQNGIGYVSVGSRGLKPTAAKKPSPLKRTETRDQGDCRLRQDPPIPPEKGGEKQVFGVFGVARTPKPLKHFSPSLQGLFYSPYADDSSAPLGR
jgi:hypothetical protein